MCTFTEFIGRLPSVLQSSQMLVDACQKAFQAWYEQRRHDEVAEVMAVDRVRETEGADVDTDDNWYSAQFEREGYSQ